MSVLISVGSTGEVTVSKSGLRSRSVRGRTSRFVVLALLANLCAIMCPAQSTFGSFVGTIRDSSGATVPDCVVTLTNQGTSARRTSLSGKDGTYVLVNLEPGSYQITIEAVGFQPTTISNLVLASRQTVRADG